MPKKKMEVSNIKITKQMIDNAAFLDRLRELNDLKSKSKTDLARYDNQFKAAIDRFAYLVEMHANKYKMFGNHQDLLQEGYLGLCMALRNFDSKRSKNFFQIAHWYIKTRIKRAANKHDVMSPSLKQSRINKPIRLKVFPTICDMSPDADDIFDSEEQLGVLDNILESLDHPHKDVVAMYFGMTSNVKEGSISSIAKKTKMPKELVQQVLSQALTMIAEQLDKKGI